MPTAYIDVSLEVPEAELVALGRDAASRFLLERSRAEAERKAADVAGAQLRTDVLPDLIFRRGSHLLLGGDWIMVSSRWAVEGPEDAIAREVSRERG